MNIKDFEVPDMRIGDVVSFGTERYVIDEIAPPDVNGICAWKLKVLADQPPASGTNPEKE